MKKPKYITDDSKMIAIAPSFGVTFSPYLERYKASIVNLKELGYTFDEGNNVHLNVGLMASNTAKKRAEEFQKAYLDDKYDAIFSVGGGETMCEILPYIDFNKIKRSRPKWFIGYSDNTNLTFTLTTICDVESIYGPCLTTYYEKPLRLSEENVFKMLKGEKHFEGYPYYSKETNDKNDPFNRLNLTEKKEVVSKNYTKPIEGILLGGCLDCLLTIVGTKFDKVKEFKKRHNEKIIWFLESCDLSLLGIRRGLFQLIEASWLTDCAAIIIGRENKNEYFDSGISKEECYSILDSLNVPILFDCDFGHIPPVLPIRCGAKCKITYKDQNIIMDYYD